MTLRDKAPRWSDVQTLALDASGRNHDELHMGISSRTATASMKPRLGVWVVALQRAQRRLQGFTSMRPGLNVRDSRSHHKSLVVKDPVTPFRAKPEFGSKPERCALFANRKCQIPIYIHLRERSREISCHLTARGLIASQTQGSRTTLPRLFLPAAVLGSQAAVGS